MSETLRLAPAGPQTTGPVHWIDHFVVFSEDVPRWAAFNTRLLGALDKPAVRGIFQLVGPSLIGAFPAEAPLPTTAGIGTGLPRYGYYVEKADLGRHISRLNALGVAHSGPQYTTSGGDPGTAVYWQDPDGNQFEFWAPDAPPAGAFEDCSSEGIGRISHATFESRDLDRTADFFKRYCDLEPVRSPDIAPDTLVLRLAAGARIVYQRVTTLSRRTCGLGLNGVHTALTVHQDAFFPNYRRLWAGVPDFGLHARTAEPGGTLESLPARSGIHPSPEGRKFYEVVGKGDDFYDWDTNMFHFIGGTPLAPALTRYEPHTIGAYQERWMEEHGTLEGFRTMVIGV
jgi:catechol 2,3-dioxygenase-like lactoylglutathione lyase family enzyme